MLDWSSLSYASLHLSSHILHPGEFRCGNARNHLQIYQSFEGCTLINVHFWFFRKLRKKEHEQILINLCFALMGMYIAFILGAVTAPVPVLCGISSALLQYFMLVFFSWTAAEAFYLYRKLVTILGVKEIPWLVLKIGLIVWCRFNIYYSICHA